jgi:hypothetical protein
MNKQILLIISIVGVSLAACTSVSANASPVPPGFLDHSPRPLTHLNITGYNATQLCKQLLR